MQITIDTKELADVTLEIPNGFTLQCNNCYGNITEPYRKYTTQDLILILIGHNCI